MLMLSQHLGRFLQQTQLTDVEFVVALSGGVDSVALLLAAVEAKKQIPQLSFSAIHINHGLSDNASIWQQHCKSLCERHNVRFAIETVSILKDHSQSIEHLARIARYKTIASRVPEECVVMTAHHIGDQAETFLLRLMRRAGLTGLGAMRRVAPFPDPLGRQKNIRLARPFLDLDKSQLVAYVEAYNTKWVEDESNLSLSFDRNFVRQQVFPVLTERWRDCAEAIGHTAELLQQEADLLNEYVRDDLMSVIKHEFANTPSLEIASFETYSNAKIRAVIRMFCFEQTQSYPSQKVINEVVGSLMTAKSDQQPEIHFGDNSFRRHRGNLYIVPAKYAFDPSSEISGQCHQPLTLIGHPLYQTITVEVLGTESDKSLPFNVRFYKNKDKLEMPNGVGSKTVKQAYKDMGCPPWWRNAVPLIYIEDKLVAIGDRYIHAQWRDKLVVKLS